jgi:sulfate adenylyltransferase subunit 1
MLINAEPYIRNRPSPLSHDRALRFLVAGSVDDGKSTLTGRLLFESRAILSDQLGKLQRSAGDDPIDFSRLTDGLEAEREQGITIDVAYRYFSTPKRKFIIADAPGHEQYTRNMVTAAAGSDAAIVLVDLTKLDLDASPIKLLDQTRRHTMLVHLLRIPEIIFAVNKIDAVPEAGAAFRRASESLETLACAAEINVSAIVPISALRGDNITERSGYTPWYQGPTLLELLENLPARSRDAEGPLLIPIQYVGRDSSTADRVFWGRVARGTARVGNTVSILPSNVQATIRELRYAGESTATVEPGRSAGLILDRHVDVARGSWVSAPNTLESSCLFSAWVAWMDTEAAQLNRKYLVRHGSRWVQGRIIRIESCLDVRTLERVGAHALAVNEIGYVTLETHEPLAIEPFASNATAGSMIIVDPSTNQTSGVVLITGPLFEEPDSREAVRVPVNLTLDFLSENGETGVARAENLSLGGLLMTSDRRIALGGSIDVRLNLGDCGDPIRLKAFVVADRPGANSRHHYHLAFYDMDVATHVHLAPLIREAQ